MGKYDKFKIKQNEDAKYFWSIKYYSIWEKVYIGHSFEDGLRCEDSLMVYFWFWSWSYLCTVFRMFLEYACVNIEVWLFLYIDLDIRIQD